MKIMDLNRELFDQYRNDKDTPILVDFWAPWCVYCRRIAPAMDLIAQQYEDQLLIGKVNIDQEEQLAQEEKIEVIPTLVIYKGGQVLGSVVAPDSKAAIEKFIRETLGI